MGTPLRRDSKRITGGLILAYLLSQFSIKSVSSLENVPTVHSNLQVRLEPSTLLHRRSTRENTNNAGGRWVPVHPKFRRTLENRYFDPRAMTLHPPFSHQNLQPRPMPFKGPPNTLKISRPSQPEVPPYPTQLYGPPPSIPNMHPTSSNYVPPVHVPPPRNQTTGEVLMNNPSESELRFLFHRPEDENLIKSTILEESQRYNERVSFVRGPTLKFQRRQTIYLPPRKKSVIYIMLKEPQVQTDLEVIEPQSDPTPEVNIVYEKAGGITTKHYYSTGDKLLQNGSSGSSSNAGGYQTHHHGHSNHQHYPDMIPGGSEIENVRIPLVTTLLTTTTSSPTASLETEIGKKRSVLNQVTNPCQPNFNKTLRKRR